MIQSSAPSEKKFVYKESLFNNWKRCVWWFQDKCNDYQHCEVCSLYEVKQEIIEKFKTITEYKIYLGRVKSKESGDADANSR